MDLQYFALARILNIKLIIKPIKIRKLIDHIALNSNLTLDLI